MDNQPIKNFISFSSKSIWASVIIYLLIVIVIIIGSYYFGYNQGLAKGAEKGRAQTSQEMQNKLSQSPMVQADQNKILRISGEILNKSEASAAPQFLTVSAANLNRNPLSAPTPAQRKILISADTKIIKKIRKPSDQIAKERYQYAEEFKKNPNATMPETTIDSPIA
ncbi:MAG: hypothetical protein PHF50_03940, partial [Patescibacteria group bacterium]|nr:hypothetical protein [Patescibacteria group bacterium]